MRKSLFLMFMTATIFASPADSVIYRASGVKINVLDMEKAINFYCFKLGFQLEKGDKTSTIVFLKTGDHNRLILNRVNNLAPQGEKDIRATLTLQVNHIDSTIMRLKALDVEFAEIRKRKEGVGDAMTIVDPFQNRISLMHQTIVKVEPFTEPRIYNYGFYIPDMDTLKKFYSEIFGFKIRSEKYLPLDLPLGHNDKSFGFMLHYREGVQELQFNTADDQRIVILFSVNNLESAISKLSKRGVIFQQKKIKENQFFRHISFYDPFGYLSELIEWK